MYRKGTQGPCEVPCPPNPTTREGWPLTGVYNPYSFRIVMWALLRPKEQISESAVRRDIRCFVLIREDYKV